MSQLSNTQKFKTVTDFLNDARSSVLLDTRSRSQKAWFLYRSHRVAQASCLDLSL